MGCFLACFGGAKDRRQRRRAKKSLPTNGVNRNYAPLQTSPSPQKVVVVVVNEEADVPAPELRENREQLSPSRKKVTFDLNVKTYEDVDGPVEEEEAAKEEGKEEVEGTASSNSSYRYQNCDNSDDDCLDDDDDGYDEDSDFEDEVAIVATEEESYDSFFSLPMDNEKPKQSCEEVDSPMPITTSTVSAKASARDRSQYVHSVLNPVENLSQWKEVKARALPVKNADKENMNSELESKMKNHGKENNTDSASTRNNGTKQEISVDASLSTWLISSENSPKSGRTQESNSQWSNTSVSREEQPILGALTIDDLKHSSVSSSPRRSPSRNPDEIPILGTVGSYWSSKAQKNSDTKGIPNTTSKYKEDKRVIWHSTPFEVRLEKTLSKGAAEA